MRGYMPVGLKKGTVELVSHQKEWSENANNIIGLIKQLLGNFLIWLGIHNSI